MTGFVAAAVSASERGEWWPDSWFGRCWVIFGFVAQFIFAARFIVQWIASEKRKKSHVPESFWYISLAGGVMLATYAIFWKRDPVLTMGQGSGIFVYLRNIMLLEKEKRRLREAASLCVEPPVPEPPDMVHRAADMPPPSKAPRSRLRWWAAAFLAAATVILIYNFIWVLSVEKPVPTFVPPAGEVLPGKAPFRFAVVGDSQGNMAIFEEILNRIKKDDVSLLIHAGDLVERCDEGQYNWFQHEMGEANIQVPFCPVPGNHDIDDRASTDDARYALYTRGFGPRRYWFACANTLFVALDDAKEHFTSEDAAWLDETLQRLRKDYKACFVYTHVPPRGPHAGYGEGHTLREGGKELMLMLAKHHVSALFTGHIHTYFEDNAEGVPVYISGGAAAHLERPTDTNHYLLCTVQDDGAFTVVKKDTPRERNDDYLEYVFRVKYPSHVLPAIATVLCGAGFAMMIADFRRTRKSPTPPAAN